MKNKYEIRGDVTAIYLNRRDGKTMETLIDTEDLNIIPDFNWYAILSKPSNSYYVLGIRGGKKNKISILLHRLITDAPKGKQVDHINHNTLDNRKCNLRITTVSENGQNRISYPKNNTSGIRGVSWQKKNNKWRVQLTVNQKKIFFGLFEDKEEAREVAQKAISKYYPFSKESLLYSGDIRPKVSKINKKSGVKGVYWQNNKWIARIVINGKQEYLGYFTKLQEAEEAVIEARLKIIS